MATSDLTLPHLRTILLPTVGTPGPETRPQLRNLGCRSRHRPRLALHRDIGLVRRRRYAYVVHRNRFLQNQLPIEEKLDRSMQDVGRSCAKFWTQLYV
jgi:hypothetical protein